MIDFNKKKENKVKKREYDEEFNEIIFFAEKVFINPLSSAQLEVLSEAYYELKLPTEVMQYLIEYMAQGEQYSSRYIKAVATSWYEQGIKTKDEAIAYVNSFTNSKTKSKKESLASKETRDKAENYFEKYINKNFTTEDILKLFFDDSEENKAILEYLKQRFLIDFIQVAFNEPENNKKTEFIKKRYDKEHYYEFLETPYWQIIARYKKLLCDAKCEICGSTQELNIHHKSYEIHGQEHLMENIENNLMCLCSECHRTMHEVSN